MSRNGIDGDIDDSGDVDGLEGDRSRGQETNFEVSRTWDLLTEGADGSITGAVEDLLEANKRRRQLKDTTPLQRGIIRHLILILDMSVAMNEKDFRPNRYLITLLYTVAFIREYFEQNPISQLGIIGMRAGLAERVSDMSGNPSEHIKAIQKLRTREPAGQPSLENALEMARAALFHAPSHGTREVLLVFGALHSSDPGDVHRTIDNLVADKIHASVIGLAAQVAICRELVSKTNNGDISGYNICIDEKHFRELIMAITTPPATHEQAQNSSSLLMMGFPSRTIGLQPSLCACHAQPTRTSYFCSRCQTKVCGLPSECPGCKLTLILSTHLARSYHHLFPLVNWREVQWKEANQSTNCFACQKKFPTNPGKASTAQKEVKASSSGRYECTVCHYHFCIDCDIFAHEVVHNCPGCQSGGAEAALMGESEHQIASASTTANGDMTMDE